MRVFLFLTFFISLSFGIPSCEDLRQDKELLKSIDLSDSKWQELVAQCEYSLKNQDFLKELYVISNEIRGSNNACSGFSYLPKLHGFNALLLNIALDPISYQKGLKDPEEIANKAQLLRAYFRYWAYQSIGNYRLYKGFWSEYNKAKSELENYFKQNFKFDAGSNIYYAENALNEFLNWAVGETKIYKDISPLSKFVINKNYDSNALKEYIYSKQPSIDELTIALQAALLAQRENSILNTLLDFGARLDEGYESAIFFALQNESNLSFLLEKGANVNATNAFGKTPLFYALEFNDKNIINLLLENKANVNARYINNSEKLAISSNVGGATPYFITLCALEHTSKSLFMHAAEYSDTQILQELINRGVKADERDDLGFNALDFALGAKKSENAKFLSNLGLKASSFDSKSSENFYQGEAQ